MSNVKYQVKEYNPTTQNQGSHSYYADIVINNDVNNTELAKKIAARTGFKAYECQGIIAAIAEIVFEETLASNRVTLSDENGTRFVTIYPRVQGSVSDLDIERETTAFVADGVIRVILNSQYCLLFNPQYNFHLITQDPDDNKFVDCAIVANADYIVSEDSHFRVLAEIPFPKVNVVSLDNFLRDFL